jgi:hypothetical protein
MSWIIVGILFGVGLLLAPLVLRLTIYAAVWAAIIFIPLGLLIGLGFGGFFLIDAIFGPFGGLIILAALVAFGVFWHVKQKEVDRYWRKHQPPFLSEYDGQ